LLGRAFLITDDRFHSGVNAHPNVAAQSRQQLARTASNRSQPLPAERSENRIFIDGE
jgi:hypothetical protein